MIRDLQIPPPEREPYSVSVTLLTYNRIAQLSRCLESLLPQLRHGDEIVVLDTGSTDGTNEYLSTADARIRRQSLGSSGGLDFGRARNALVRMARAEAVAFIDDDCIAAPDWLAKVRQNLSHSHAAGGSCLPARSYGFPAWWHSDINWAVGLSTNRFLARDLASYPATSNLAAWRTVLERFPFGETQHDFASGNKYLGGREDSVWWKEIRCAGFKTAVDPRQVVFHDISEDRLVRRYVQFRAKSDGIAHWNRQGNTALAASLPAEVIRAAFATVRSLTTGDRRAYAASQIWYARQWSCLQAARQSPEPACRNHVTNSALLKTAGDAIGRKLARFSLKLRNQWSALFRPTTGAMHVSAESHLGDTLLLGPVLQALASANPGVAITACTRFSEFLAKGLPVNITTVSAVPSERCAADVKKAGLALVPYHAHGDETVWWRYLAPIARTFNWEVGFPSPLHYSAARQLVPKDPGVHELHNLWRLFSVPTLFGRLAAPTLPQVAQPDSEYKTLSPDFNFSRPYVVLQLGSGWPHKAPASEIWKQIVNSLTSEYLMPVILIGSETETSVGNALARANPEQVINLCTPFPVSQLIGLIRGARLLVGSCSGPKHIAMAVGTPTFTVYTITEPERWGDVERKPIHGYIRALPGPLTAGEHLSLASGHIAGLITIDRLWQSLQNHIGYLQTQSRWASAMSSSNTQP